MKVLIVVLLSAMLSASFASKSPEDFPFDFKDVDYVTELVVNGYEIILNELKSFKLNMVKQQVTSFSGEIPAYDVLYNFTGGKMYQYFNLTGDCKAYDIPRMNLTDFYKSLINSTEFVGKRGENLYLYEQKFPNLEGSRQWLYGFFMSGEESDEKFFVPSRIQQHFPSISQDLHGRFMDMPAFPNVTYFDFYYPACLNATSEPMNMPFNYGMFSGLEQATAYTSF